MKKILALVLVLILAFGVLVACGDDAPEDDGSLVIGVSMPTLENAFFVGMLEGIRQGAEIHGVELVELNANGDIALQTSQVEDLVTQEVDAILICPIDSDAIVAVQQSVIDAGIPLIYIDRGASSPGYDSFVATDNVAMGALGAELIADFLTERHGSPMGKVVELQGLIGTSAARDRGDGFNDRIAEWPDIEIIARQPGDFNQEVSLAVMENIIQANPEIDAVFTHNDDNALGVLRAIEGAGLLRSPDADDFIFVVGIDGISDAIMAVRAGDLAATISQDPIGMGITAVGFALDIINGDSVPLTFDQPFYVIDEANANDDDHWGIS